MYMYMCVYVYIYIYIYTYTYTCIYVIHITLCTKVGDIPRAVDIEYSHCRTDPSHCA